METVFEKIIKKEINSYIIHSENEFIIILDINPKNLGHSLVIPKIKSENVLMMDDMTLSRMFLLGKEFSIYLKEKLNATGVKWAVNSGEDAGQVVFHTHLHLIPYYSGGIRKDIDIENVYKILKK